MLMRQASEHYGWDLDYGNTALLWREGCIIRSAFLGNIRDAYAANPDLVFLGSDAGELRYDWTSDASTSILSSDASQTTITRSEIGDSELSVQIVNAAGIPLGRASRVVSVTVPSSRIEDSARQKAGWTDWQEAQAQWKIGRAHV